MKILLSALAKNKCMYKSGNKPDRVHWGGALPKAKETKILLVVQFESLHVLTIHNLNGA